MTIHIDQHIGVSHDRVYWMRSADGKMHWCRTPIAIMGSFNTSDKYRSQHSPFEPHYEENYVEGKGKTKEEAFERMKQELKTMSDSLWEV